ncbi:MAG: hypothetical protein ACLPXU_02770 [Acidimicrobiales bacterium]
MSTVRNLGAIGAVVLVLAFAGFTNLHGSTTGPTMSPAARTTSVASRGSGASTTAAQPQKGFVAAQLFTPTNNVIYVVGTSSGPEGGRVELFRSDNRGSSFQQEALPPASRLTTVYRHGNLTVQFQGAERGVAIVGSSLFVTSDGGRSWPQARGPISGTWVYLAKGNTVRMEAAGSVAYVVVIHCLNGDSCPSYGLYRSTNWFSSWVEEPAPDSGKFNAAGGIDLSAFGSDVWILVGNGVSQLTLFGSTNEGRSFEKLVAPSAISCGTTPFSDRVLWISCSTGMQVAFFRSTDGGAHLTRLQIFGFGTDGTQLWPVSASTAFFQPGITAVRPGFFRTTDGGRIFVKLRGLPAAFGTVGQDVASVSFADDLDGFALLSTGLIFGTSDGGSTWTPVLL